MNENNTKSRYRFLSPSQMLSWIEDDTQIMRLHSDRDVIPGGYMAAAMPMLVDWPNSNPHGEPASIVLRNINYGGNPFEKSTILHNVRVPIDGLKDVELTLVPFGKAGRLGPLQHVQLRFIFEPGREPELLDLAGTETGADPHIPDIVMGWVSWQRPDIGWDLRKGMDDDAQIYWLSLRAYAGSQIFLEDALQGRDWFSYPLQLPGGKKGLIELFKTTVTLGDGTARDTLARMLMGGEKAWLKHPPPQSDTEQTIHHQWDKLLKHVKASDPKALAPVHLPPELDTYQPLVRSCATLARYAVLLTVKRLIAMGHHDGVVLDQLPEPLLEATETWMKDFAHASLRKTFLLAPLAMRYVMRHHESVPPDIPYEFDAAGLLQRRNGNRYQIHYNYKNKTPYGQAFFP
ncbi:hypothetical protein MNBD_GAMMA19-397 [hydrothermal vent metagenome]|uniref:Uncharacterized protein n=1 Tax=hydrothermal vent metagenome TaxID=652676 RepID=A0A3B1AP55_9ZZZZ